MATAPASLAQLRRGVLEHCVLALLEGRERYGYDLVSDLSEAGLVASEGTVYPLLSRLRREAL
ncbi:MAG: PadR family transcriptional regulator, partial [Phycicoccus sp.]